MRQKIVAGNWKMNASKSQVNALVGQLVFGLKNNHHQAKVVICPPMPYLSQAETLVKDSSVKLGVQNINANDSGAFTGEISLVMAKEFSVQYAIVGHSERRELYGETDLEIVEKIKATIASGITPIFCVGETLAQREGGQTHNVISTQVNAVIDNLGINAFKNMVVAYEPIWAIGTGVTATPNQAQDIHHFIRNLLTQQNADIAQMVSILYGGSVNGANALELFACEDIDGGLVGGASLKSEDFLTICHC